MSKTIDMKLLANKIARDTFIFKKINVIDEYLELGIFNNFSHDDYLELGKMLSKETRKYKLIKLNNETEL